MAEPFDAYLLKLRETPPDEQTEHTGRSALEGLLKEFAEKSANGKITVQHEPKRVADKGAPDFKVTRNGMILGYVENKAIGENLDKVLKSDQIKRYKSLSQNILLTDYLHFIWINKDGIQRETLCHATDLESPKFRLREDRISAVGALLEAFFSTAPDGIGRAQTLALALATRSRLLRDYLGEELVRQKGQHTEGRLYGLFQIFRDQVFHELTVKEFADAFAQMLAYGLFLARLNSDSQGVTLHNARQFVPGSFRLIRELVDFLTELEKDEYRDVRWVVEEVLSIVNGIDLASIHEDLSFRQRKAISRKVRATDEEEHRLFERDPFIYFYEDYLRAYDKQTRKSRGVYYTPPPIVNFIVRAIDDILKETFEIPDGLADHKRVTVLDFACGTGTFLLEVFQQIFENIGGPEIGRADLIVREHFLKNIYGFEYLIAPYTIAHLKLSQYLEDQKHPLNKDQRLQVFLTNTLEPIEPQENFLLPAVSAEVQAAQKVKEQPILVITGNPPYSGHSKNKGKWITTAIDGYKFMVESDENGKEVRKPLGERNPKWLQDDYVKFIRFAQLKMDAVEEGIVGVITNHSWLDNPTFRGMRQSLMRSFQQIYVLDLHGSVKKKERAPDGSKDENVFDIEQGVAISLFVKRPGIERGVWKSDIWGKRLDKYRTIAGGSCTNLITSQANPVSPNFLYIIQDLNIAREYNRGWPINSILNKNSIAIVTGHDSFAYAFDQRELNKRLRDFVKEDTEVVRSKYKLGKDKADWSIDHTQSDIRAGGSVTSAYYRPFDFRFTLYTGRTAGFHVRPRKEVMQHLLSGGLALVTCRFVVGEWQHVLAAEGIVDNCLVSTKTKERGYAFPLFVDGIENFTPDFREFIDSRYENHYTPEEILGYIYAVLHAPTYRERYAEFLRIDFPRIPFSEDAEDFETLSALGWALIDAHLLREPPRHGLGTYHGKGDHAVEAVRYSPKELAIHINKTQFFQPVPQAVWDFHIGGYRVLDKYLVHREEV